MRGSIKTVDLLRQHKRAQAELKMANRTTYHENIKQLLPKFQEIVARMLLAG